MSGLSAPPPGKFTDTWLHEFTYPVPTFSDLSARSANSPSEEYTDAVSP